MAISIRCQCGKSFTAGDELAGRIVNCPACGETLTIGDRPGPARAVTPTNPEPLDQIEMAMLQLRRLHGATRAVREGAHTAPGHLLASVGLGCLGALITMFVVVGILIALIGPEAQAKSKSPVPGLVGIASGFVVMGGIILGMRTKRRRRAEIAAVDAQAAIKNATDDLVRRFPNWVQRIGGVAALQREESINDALSMSRQASGAVVTGAVSASAELTRAMPPIPIGFKVWSNVALRTDEKIEKWQMLGRSFIAAESGQVILTGFEPLSTWLQIVTLGMANSIFLRGFFLKMREETIRPEDIRRVVINKEMFGHYSYHLVVDQGKPIYPVHLFLAANKGNDEFLMKFFKSLLPAERVTVS